MIEEGSPAWLRWKLEQQLKHDYEFKKKRAFKYYRILSYMKNVKGRETLEKKVQKWIDKAGAVLIKIEQLKNERTKE